MPIVKRKHRPHRDDFEVLTDEQRRTLHNGRGFFAQQPAFASVEDMKFAWSIHRDAVMAEFIAERPCHRPFAWWLFDHGHERPIISEFGFPEPVLQRYRDEKFGFLHTSIWCCPGYFQEPEPDYLQRLGLLEFGEEPGHAEH